MLAIDECYYLMFDGQWRTPQDQIEDIQMSDYRVVRLKTPEDCEGFALNVDKKHPDLAKQARRRAVELRAGAHGATSDAEVEAL